MPDSLRIGIAGCGIGGLAAALLLARNGHDITLYDQFERPAPLGSGLVIQPVGLDVLRTLGLAETVINLGHKIYKMSGIESRNRRGVLNVDYGPKNGNIFGIGIHRASLFEVLYQAALREGLRIESGHFITESTLKDNKRWLKTKTAQSLGPFDMIIDASGARSKLSPIKSHALPFGALWGTVDWPQNTSIPTGQLNQCYHKAENMMGVLPVGNLPGSTTMKATIFWSEKAVNLPNWRASDLEAWKEKAIKLWPEFEPFITQINHHSEMIAATYSHGTLGKPYGQNIVYIGDSAHQASPQLGQGANMALLDALALTTALELNQNNIDKAFKTYARRRYWHVRLYQIFSAVFTPFYQSESRILPIFRNNLLNSMSYIWPVKPMLTRLVCGNLIKAWP